MCFRNNQPGRATIKIAARFAGVAGIEDRTGLIANGTMARPERDEADPYNALYFLKNFRSYRAT
jgi:hypothetical protein